MENNKKNLGTQAPVDRGIRSLEIHEKYKTTRTLLKCALTAFAFWMAKDCIVALAGHNTTVIANILVAVVGDFRLELAVVLTGFASLWALIERVIRQQTVKRLHRRISELELTLDPNRTTSHLTKKGQTNPRDRKSR